MFTRTSFLIIFSSMVLCWGVGCDRVSNEPLLEKNDEVSIDAGGEPLPDSLKEDVLEEFAKESSPQEFVEQTGDGGEKEITDVDPIEATQDAGGESLPERSLEFSPEVTRLAKCTDHTFSIGGRDRLYILCVPDPLPVGDLPVVMGFHGGGGNATQWKNALAWQDTAARYGFVMVFMQGCNDRLPNCAGNLSYVWNIGKPGESSNMDDQAYTLDVLRRLATVHGLNIDAKRRYATGHSMGGMFAYSLLCDRPNLFSAIGPISSPPSDGTCSPHKNTAIFHVHGAVDPNVPFTTGCCSKEQKTVGASTYLQGCETLPQCFNPSNWWPPVRSGDHPFAKVIGLDAMAKDGLGCNLPLQETKRTKTTLCRRYSSCSGSKGAEVCLVDGVGHSLRDLDQAFDLREHLWARFDAVR